MQLNEKNIFLLDGLGAVSSALLTGGVLPVFSEQLGMPVNILRALALLPIFFATYSFSCFALTKRIQPWMLVAIIIANLFYCIISSGLIVAYDITFLGKVFFIAEIVVILGVVGLELRVLFNFLKKQSL